MNLLSQDAAALEAILRTDDLPVANSTWSPFLPFLSWLVSLLNPELTVDLGFEVDSPFHAVWRAAQRLESPSKCVVVLLAEAGQSEQERRSAEQRFNAVIAQSALRFGGTLEGVVEEPDSPVDEGGVATSGFPPIHLLHLGLSHDGRRAPSYLQEWIDGMAPGGVLVIPNTRSTGSSEFAEARRYIADRVPSTVISFGPNSEILVAEVPRNGATPLVNLLDDAPPAFRGLFALFAERSEFRHVSGVRADITIRSQRIHRLHTREPTNGEGDISDRPQRNPGNDGGPGDGGGGVEGRVGPVQGTGESGESRHVG